MPSLKKKICVYYYNLNDIQNFSIFIFLKKVPIEFLFRRRREEKKIPPEICCLTTTQFSRLTAL